MKRKQTWMKKAIIGCMSATLLVPAAMPVAAAGKKEVKTYQLDKKALTLTIGTKKTLKVKPAVKAKNIQWKSSNKKVATISKNGVVTAKKKGIAKITFSVNKKKQKAVCKVTVKKAATNPKAKPTETKPTETKQKETKNQEATPLCKQQEMFDTKVHIVWGHIHDQGYGWTRKTTNIPFYVIDSKKKENALWKKWEKTGSDVCNLKKRFETYTDDFYENNSLILQDVGDGPVAIEATSATVSYQWMEDDTAQADMAVYYWNRMSPYHSYVCIVPQYLAVVEMDKEHAKKLKQCHMQLSPQTNQEVVEKQVVDIKTNVYETLDYGIMEREENGCVKIDSYEQLKGLLKWVRDSEKNPWQHLNLTAESVRCQQDLDQYDSEYFKDHVLCIFGTFLEPEKSVSDLQTQFIKSVYRNGEIQGELSLTTEKNNDPMMQTPEQTSDQEVLDEGYQKKNKMVTIVVEMKRSDVKKIGAYSVQIN